MKQLIIGCCILFMSWSVNAQIATAPNAVSPLLIGEKLPSVALMNMQGQEVTVSSIVTQKSVLIVYRGGWCPYCNKQLSGLAAIEKDIQKLGYQIIAISPDAPAALQQTMQKNALTYQLYSDAGGEFGKAMGLLFAAPAAYHDLLLKSSAGKNSNTLPVPAVYVVNENRQVEFMYVSPDYTRRMNEQMLLAVLRSLSTSL